MNEELDKAMTNVAKTIEKWEEEKTRQTAFELQMQLSILKLIIGIERFDELPCFSRILKEVTIWIDKHIDEEGNDVL